MVVNNPPYTLQDIANRISATVHWGKHPVQEKKIHKITSLDQATGDDLSFVSHAQNQTKAKKTQAGALIVPQFFADLPQIQLVHPHPHAAMAQVGQLFYQPYHPQQNSHDLAYIKASAQVDPSAQLYPFCVIEEEAKIGAGCVIYPHVYIGAHCEIGENTTIYPGAVLMERTQVGARVVIHSGAVLGSDGFGFIPTAETLEKIPQVGHVVIEDDVELGAVNTIDRATFAETRVRKGCKLDSQVHIAHNVDLGEESMLCGQAAIAGSSQIGKRFIAGGKASVGPQVEIGAHVHLGALTGMIKSTPVPGAYADMPSQPLKEWSKQRAALKKLPELLKTVRQLEKTIAELKKSHMD